MSGKESVSLKIMLVEDDEGFRRNLAGLLTSRFPSIVIGEAGDGVEVMQKVKSFSPQLILMDIKLPGQSGLEVTRRIKALYLKCWGADYPYLQGAEEQKRWLPVPVDSTPSL